jgi:U4/U6 small nuclear ribonucleoprotein PRP4
MWTPPKTLSRAQEPPLWRGPHRLTAEHVSNTARFVTRAGTLLHTLLGHADRLGRCRWHPSGEFLATAGYDATWRLWDAATGAQLLVQEGHARAVYAVAFQPDGSLAISGGLDGHARVWDLRTGHSVCLLKGHCQGITACDWSPDGYTCATGSADHATRVWDVRQAGRCVAVLPAHGGTITSVRFEPTAGGALLTASHDATCKLWGAPNWTLLRALRTGEGRVMAADLAPGAVLMATASYDRAVKVWAAPATLPTVRGDADMADE